MHCSTVRLDLTFVSVRPCRDDLGVHHVAPETEEVLKYLDRGHASIGCLRRLLRFFNCRRHHLMQPGLGCRNHTRECTTYLEVLCMLAGLVREREDLHRLAVSEFRHPACDDSTHLVTVHDLGVP